MLPNTLRHQRATTLRLTHTAEHVTGIQPTGEENSHAEMSYELGRSAQKLPCCLGGRLPDGEAPPRDGGAAGQLPQLHVGAHRPDQKHRIAQLPAPRDLIRPRRCRSRRRGLAVPGGAAEEAASR